MRPSRFFIIFTLLLLVRESCHSQHYPLWDNLSPGKYNIGFKRLYYFDSSRQYAFRYLPKIDEDSTMYYRPTVINVWFPSTSKSKNFMKYEGYYDFSPPDNSWNNFLTRVREFNLQVTMDNSFTKPNGKNSNQLQLFDSLLQTPTSIRLGAKPLPEKHPLVLYYPGMGGTIEESSLLCEYLASNGYVVVSSLYQPNHIKHLYSDWDLDRSKKDRDFVLHVLKLEKNIDLSKIYLLGFSFGAQSNLYYELEENPAIKAVVLLDSRLEYSFNCHPKSFKNLPDTLLKNKSKINKPMLCMTELSSTYKLFDSLVFCERHYMRIPYFEHFNFTSQYELSQYLNYKADTSLRISKKKWELYKIVCQNIGSFLNSNLNDTLFNTIVENENDYFPDSLNLNIEYEHRRKGEVTQSYNSSNLKISLPIQLLNLIQAKSFKYVEDNFSDLLFDKHLVSEVLNNNYGYYLIGVQNFDEAIKIFKWNTQLFPNSWNAFDSLGAAYSKNNQSENALVSYQKSLELNPDNKHAIDFIRLSK